MAELLGATRGIGGSDWQSAIRAAMLWKKKPAKTIGPGPFCYFFKILYKAMTFYY